MRYPIPSCAVNDLIIWLYTLLPYVVPSIALYYWELAIVDDKLEVIGV